MLVDEGWYRLPEHWRLALRQAWAAYRAGTIPVGAVVVDPHGIVAAEARNRVFDVDAPPVGQLAGSLLAHAEMNALAQIGAVRSTESEGWAVFSTLEPCAMCAGAIRVSFRGRITVGYASEDPTGGGLQMITATDIGHSRQWEIQRLDGPFAFFAELLFAAYTIKSRSTSRAASHYRQRPWLPLIETAGAVLVRERDRGASVEQGIAAIWTTMTSARLNSGETVSP